MRLTIALLAGVAAAVAAPHAAPEPAPGVSRTLEARSTKVCGQWDSVQTGGYIVYQDLWGESSGTGSQCTTVNSASGGSISWSTAWSWSGGPSSVKSYANVVLGPLTSAHALSSLKSIPTKWAWSYTGSNTVGDVSYDLFTGTSLTGTGVYEIMVWLAAYGGAFPISATGQPIATVTIGGVSFKLYKGSNGTQTTFSFVATSNQQNFSSDLNDFIQYLVKNQGIPSSQILQSIGAGTEPFTGSNAVLTTSSYSVSIS